MTFYSQVTVATLSDIYYEVVLALGSLRGSLHGVANEAVMTIVENIGILYEVNEYIQRKLDNQEKIMGFGYQIYKNGDPRAKHLQQMSRQLSIEKGDMSLYEMSVRIEELVIRKKD